MSDAHQAIRDLCLVRDEDISAVQAAVTALWLAWAEAWGLEGLDDEALTVTLAQDADADLAQRDWEALSPNANANAANAWMILSEPGLSAMAAGLVGCSGKASLPPEDFAHDVAQAALSDWRRRLSDALSTASATPSSDLDTPRVRAQAWWPLSGALLVTHARLGWHGLLPKQAYRALTKPAPAAPAEFKPSQPITGLLHTLSSHRVPLCLGLGEIEIPVADLLGLQAGDVIPFPTRLSDQLPVAVGSDALPSLALHCQLGQRDGRLAIRVSAKAPLA